MIPTLDHALQTLLDQAGFKQDDHEATGLISVADVRSDPDIYLRYGPLFDETPEGEPFSNFIYEVPSDTDGVLGTPCICFKVLDDATPAAINDIRMKVWNHGRVPTLWIVTPDSVLIYDSFARPQTDDKNNGRNHLLEELSRIGNLIQGIENFHKSKFDTGEFWQSGRGQDIAPGQRVDSALLRDLLETKRALESEGLHPTVAQALLGRVIFVKYLEDRRILQSTHLQRYGGYGEFSGILTDITHTYNFFEWLRTTFNGDLFPIEQAERDSVLEVHLGILYRFLSGHDMSRYPDSQARLWPYSFETIPIEFISSIYEMFAHTSDQETAESTSIHYTRFNLVELVLGLAMLGLPHTAKVLDPACGSGVFLVEAFKRLVRMKEMDYGRKLSREELHRLLKSQIFGIDIDQQAVYVAAFSLYLALLELDPDPQPPDALRLPRLLESDDPNEQPINLYVQDFFNTDSAFNRNAPFLDHDFDLIVGNPPWTALKVGSRNQRTEEVVRNWGAEYCLQHEIPDNKPDQAFSWRVREFSRPSTRIALVIGSRLFYQGEPKAQRWREKFLGANKIHHVTNLSDLRNENLLFGRGSSTSQPASVIIFSPTEPDSDTTVLYVSPKWYPGIRQRDEIVINSVDIQEIPQRLLQEYPFLWKTAFRGTARDFRFLQRLQSYPALVDAIGETDEREPLDRSYGLTFGSNPTKDATELSGLPFLPSKAQHRYLIDVRDLPPFTKDRIAEKSNRKPLRLPALILNRSLRDHRPCVALVEPSNGRDQMVFDRYYGISFAREPGDLANRLNAILNSQIISYMAFMLSSTLGWEREIIEPQDWLRMRLPTSILQEDSDGAWVGILEREQWLRTHWNVSSDASRENRINATEDELNDLIFQVYELSDQEIVLIKDTLSYTINPFLQGMKQRASTMLAKPNIEQLQNYASRLCAQINGILKHGGLELTATVISPRRAELTACRFGWRQVGNAARISVSTVDGIDDVLNQMSIDLRATVTNKLYIRQDLRVYDKEAFWVIKPSQARLWTEAAALNDSDAVLREHLDQPSDD